MSYLTEDVTNVKNTDENVNEETNMISSLKKNSERDERSSYFAPCVELMREPSEILQSQMNEPILKTNKNENSEARPKKKKIILETFSNVYEDLQKTNEELESLNKNLFSYINKMIDTQKGLVVEDSKSSVGNETCNQGKAADNLLHSNNVGIEESKMNEKNEGNIKYFRTFIDSSNSSSFIEQNNAYIYKDLTNQNSSTKTVSHYALAESRRNEIDNTRTVNNRDEFDAPNYSSYANDIENVSVSETYIGSCNDVVNNTPIHTVACVKKYPRPEENSNIALNSDTCMMRPSTDFNEINTPNDQEYYRYYYEHYSRNRGHLTVTDGDHPLISTNLIVCTEETPGRIERNDGRSNTLVETPDLSNYADNMSLIDSEGKIKTAERCEEPVHDIYTQNIIKRYDEYKRNITQSFDERTQTSRDGSMKRKSKTEPCHNSSEPQHSSRITYGEYKRKAAADKSRNTTTISHSKNLDFSSDIQETNHYKVQPSNKNVSADASTDNITTRKGNNSFGQNFNKPLHCGKSRDDFRGRVEVNPTFVNPSHSTFSKPSSLEKRNKKNLFERESSDIERTFTYATAPDTKKLQKPSNLSFKSSRVLERNERANLPCKGWNPENSRYGRKLGRRVETSKESSLIPFSPFNLDEPCDSKLQEMPQKDPRSINKVTVKERDPAEILSSILESRENRKYCKKTFKVTKASASSSQEGSSKQEYNKTESNKLLSTETVKSKVISEPVVSSTVNFVEDSDGKSDFPCYSISAQKSLSQKSDIKKDDLSDINERKTIPLELSKKDSKIEVNPPVIDSNELNLVRDDVSGNIIEEKFMENESTGCDSSGKRRSDITSKIEIKVALEDSSLSNVNSIILEDKNVDINHEVQDLEKSSIIDFVNKTSHEDQHTNVLETSSKLLCHKNEKIDNRICKVVVVDIFWKEKRDGKFKSKRIHRLIQKYMKRQRRQERSYSNKPSTNNRDIDMCGKEIDTGIKVPSDRDKDELEYDILEKPHALDHEDNKSLSENRSVQLSHMKRKRRLILNSDSESDENDKESIPPKSVEENESYLTVKKGIVCENIIFCGNKENLDGKLSGHISLERLESADTHGSNELDLSNLNPSDTLRNEFEEFHEENLRVMTRLTTAAGIGDGRDIQSAFKEPKDSIIIDAEIINDSKHELNLVMQVKDIDNEDIAAYSSVNDLFISATKVNDEQTTSITSTSQKDGDDLPLTTAAVQSNVVSSKVVGESISQILTKEVHEDLSGGVPEDGGLLVSSNSFVHKAFNVPKDCVFNAVDESELNSASVPLPVIENVSSEISKSLSELEKGPNTLIETYSDSSDEEEIPLLKNLSSFFTDHSKIDDSGEDISSCFSLTESRKIENQNSTNDIKENNGITDNNNTSNETYRVVDTVRGLDAESVLKRDDGNAGSNNDTIMKVTAETETLNENSENTFNCWKAVAPVGDKRFSFESTFTNQNIKEKNFCFESEYNMKKDDDIDDLQIKEVSLIEYNKIDTRVNKDEDSITDKRIREVQSIEIKERVFNRVKTKGELKQNISCSDSYFIRPMKETVNVERVTIGQCNDPNNTTKTTLNDNDKDSSIETVAQNESIPILEDNKYEGDEEDYKERISHDNANRAIVNESSIESVFYRLKKSTDGDFKEIYGEKIKKEPFKPSSSKLITNTILSNIVETSNLSNPKFKIDETKLHLRDEQVVKEKDKSTSVQSKCITEFETDGIKDSVHFWKPKSKKKNYPLISDSDSSSGDDKRDRDPSTSEKVINFQGKMKIRSDKVGTERHTAHELILPKCFVVLKRISDKELNYSPFFSTKINYDSLTDSDKQVDMKTSKIQEVDTSEPSCSYKSIESARVESVVSKDIDSFRCIVCRKKYCTDKNKVLSGVRNFSRNINGFCENCFNYMYNKKFDSFKKKFNRKFQKHSRKF